jgi:biotin synthase
MGWRISPEIEEILSRGRDALGLTKAEAMKLMALETGSKETYALMQTADALSRELFSGKGENHFHMGINVSPCPYNCRFCSLTVQAGIFRDAITFSHDQVIDWAKGAEAEGADALNIMTTGTFSFERLLDTGRMLKKAVEIPLVANTRDIDHHEGEQLLEAGFVGAYHAVRLGEGKDTPFKIEKRINTIKVLKEVGLLWMNCVEPVGSEHARSEIVDLMFLAREYGAVYSGIMRRINFPGSPMERFGMITELEMAKMVAVSRLVMGSVPKAHCTHEPHAISLMAGANLFFPEVGASPRDGKEADTGKGRGKTLEDCQQIQQEMNLKPDLPSNCF